MSDYDGLCRFMRGKRSTVIVKYPTGKYGLAGTMPVELCTKKIGLTGEYYDSKVWNTEQEAIDALLSIGVTEFQLNDCSWYVPKGNRAKKPVKKAVKKVAKRCKK